VISGGRVIADTRIVRRLDLPTEPVLGPAVRAPSAIDRPLTEGR
jgi:hypothetical protein